MADCVVGGRQMSRSENSLATYLVAIQNKMEVFMKQ